MQLTTQIAQWAQGKPVVPSECREDASSTTAEIAPGSRSSDEIQMYTAGN